MIRMRIRMLKIVVVVWPKIVKAENFGYREGSTNELFKEGTLGS